MGGTTEKSTSSTGSSNADVNSLVSKLTKGIGAEFTPGKSLYTPPGPTTQLGWQSALGAADNSAYSGSLASALSGYGNIAAGNELGQNDPGYAAMRSKLQNDVTTGVNSSFNNSGMFGSDSNVKSLSSGLADSLGALDYKQYSDSLNRRDNATAMLPDIFASMQMPGQVQQSIGGAMDADKQAQAAGPTDYLAKLTSILSGTAASGGQTTTNTQPGVNPLLALLGFGLGTL